MEPTMFKANCAPSAIFPSIGLVQLTDDCYGSQSLVVNDLRLAKLHFCHEQAC